MLRTLLPLLALTLAACTGKEEPIDTSVPPGERDEDDDGYQAAEDCNDENAAVFPGAVELCNDLDDDCDELADEDASDPGTFYGDADGDGYGDAANVTVTCDQPTGASLTGDDCDDTDFNINPGAQEICDSLDADEDCNDLADDADAALDTSSVSTWYLDGDGDGYGDDATAFSACDAADGRTAAPGDCDDLDPFLSPAATEECDDADVDEDCDGLVDDADDSLDDADATTWYMDGDGDGYGDPEQTIDTCDVPDGFAENDEDCNDGDSALSPAAQEVCDDADVDEDCNGDADNADPNATGLATWYADVDEDTFGDIDNTAEACDLLDGYTTDTSDCDDTNVATYPAATEQCDGVANDCNSADTWTDDLEAGVVSWIDSFGGWTSETGNFSASYDWTAPGDGELVFCEGTYSALLDTDGSDVALTGLYGADATSIDAGGVGTVVTVSGGSATIEGLTLRGGAATSGGGIHCLAATLSVVDSGISGNSATSYGGGVFLQSCLGATFTGVSVTTNTASSGGGLYATNSDGIGVSDSSISENEATVLGGGLAVSNADYTVTNSSITLNSAGGSYVGGGLWSSSSTGTFNTVVLDSNWAGRGAGLYASASTLTMTGGSVSSNTSGRYGAAGYLYDGSVLTATGTTLNDNVAGEDGVLENDDSSATLSSCAFDGNVGETAVLTFTGAGTTSVTNGTFGINAPADAYAAGAVYSYAGTTASFACNNTSGCL